MCVNGEEMCAGRVNACHDEVSADVSLVAEEMLFEHCHAGDDARLAAGGECMELEVGGDEGGGEFSVCGRAGAGAPYLGGDVVQLLTVLKNVSNSVRSRCILLTNLVRNYWPTCGAGICSNLEAHLAYAQALWRGLIAYHNTTIIQAANNCGTSARGLW